jgi:hypothetical protein
MNEGLVERAVDRVAEEIKKRPRVVSSRPPSDPELDVDIREMMRTLAGLEPVIMRIAVCLDRELPPIVTRSEMSFEIGQLGIIAGQGFEQLQKRLDRRPLRRDLWLAGSAIGAAAVITTLALAILIGRYLPGLI